MTSIINQIRDLPRGHQILFWFSAFMLIWQGLYLVRWFGESVYDMVEVAVYPPSQCGSVEAKGEEASGMDPGEVFFHVDMRCANVDFDKVFVTSPLCGNCGPEEWNTLFDRDKDKVFEGRISFRTTDDNPLVDAAVQYKYGITVPGERLYYPENLLHTIAEGSSCAPVTDGITYANRVVTTDRDGSEVRDIFGTCVSVPIPDHEWEKMEQEAWEKANPFLSSRVDPWWKPLSSVLQRWEILSPVLFLSLCTAVYIYSIFVIGYGYAHRKEDALQRALNEAQHKNTYLEHAAKILRHDMHSGINTYIPRGIKSLERRLTKDPETIEKMRLGAPLRMLKEGLAHTQKVYAGVTEFTNLVKAGAKIDRKPHDLREILSDYLDTTSYKSEVVLGDLPVVEVNAPLFCTAIDNLIRNGLKYNDSPSKMVVLNMVDRHHLGILDNGRGMSHDEFLEYAKPYTRKAGQKENGTGLGLNICIAILHEHGFTVTASKREAGGTLIKVRLS